jgi:hypothetical protein
MNYVKFYLILKCVKCKNKSVQLVSIIFMDVPFIYAYKLFLGYTKFSFFLNLLTILFNIVLFLY